MKKNKIIIFVSIPILLIVVLLLFVLINNDNTTKISLEAFTKIVTEFDNETNFTIKIIDENNNDIITIKLDDDIKSISYNEDNNIYYEYIDNKIYRYFYEDDKWKRKEVSIETDPVTNDFNLKKYINVYNEIKLFKKSNIYKIDKYIDDDVYNNIEITIEDNKVRKYSYLLNDIKYEYLFSYYNNTQVKLPETFNDVYDKLSKDSLDELLNNSSNITNFMATSIYKDYISGVEYETKAGIYYNTDLKQHQEIITNNQTYIYRNEILGLTKKQYQYIKNEWILKNEEPSLVTKFNQYSFLPINLIIFNYDKIEYNEYGSSYTIKDVMIDNNSYDQLYFIVNDGRITYLYMQYAYTIDSLKHDVEYILEFSKFDEITSDEIS